MQTPPPDIIASLVRMGLLPQPPSAAEPSPPLGGEPLAGGVSSDIWRIELPTGPICIKRALPKLRVQADWRAPVERNLYEARWMRAAAQAVPGITPDLRGQDTESGALAMEFLPPEHYPLWKARLRDGNVDPAFAAAVGEALGRIHAATAANPALAADFPTDAIFYDIRLEPYLVHTARAHPDLAACLHALTERTRTTRHALVHGDVSPKNILCGPGGPVFLDAECAWWGDSAFDLAFCLNHLLLKCLWVPTCQAELLEGFAALAAAYQRHVAWETPSALEARAATLLPALFLARVDGKSPVEYITLDTQRAKVRACARRLLADPPACLRAVADAWKEELAAP